MTQAITEQTITAEEIAYWELLVGAANMKESVDNLTARLKTRRQELGLDDAEFSALSQIPAHRLHQFENGDGDILLSDLRRYALAVGVTFSMREEHSAFSVC
jgi:hypothetical protein